MPDPKKVVQAYAQEKSREQESANRLLTLLSVWAETLNAFINGLNLPAGTIFGGVEGMFRKILKELNKEKIPAIKTNAEEIINRLTKGGKIASDNEVWAILNGFRMAWSIFETKTGAMLPREIESLVTSLDRKISSLKPKIKDPVEADDVAQLQTETTNAIRSIKIPGEEKELEKTVEYQEKKKQEFFDLKREVNKLFVYMEDNNLTVGDAVDAVKTIKSNRMERFKNTRTWTKMRSVMDRIDDFPDEDQPEMFKLIKDAIEKMAETKKNKPPEPAKPAKKKPATPAKPKRVRKPSPVKVVKAFLFTFQSTHP